MNSLNTITRLMLSIQFNDVEAAVSLLKDSKLDPDLRFKMSPINDVPAVCLCAKRGLYEMTKVLINAGCSVNQTDYHGHSCLYFAIIQHHTELVKLLLKNRANVNLASDFNRTPLHIACQQGSLEIVDLLLKHGADINKKDNDGKTSLVLACLNQQTEVVKYLLETGNCDVNTFDNKANSPLICTVNSDFRIKTEIVNLLLEHGANVNHFNIYGYTGLNTLIRQSSESNLANLELAKNLIEHNCNLEFKGPIHFQVTPVLASVYFNQDAITELLIRSGCNLEEVDLKGKTVLYNLIANQKLHLVRLSVRSGANLNKFFSSLKMDNRTGLIELLSYIQNLELKNYLSELSIYNYTPFLLKHCCRIQLRKQLGRRADEILPKLNLPKLLLNYVLLNDD